MNGTDVMLIVITVIVALMIAATTLYILVAFQHPEDHLQAWFPKFVVCISLFIAISTVLLFPLDVANRRACNSEVYSNCDFALPMYTLWYIMYISNIVLVYLVIPFTVFYYEADSDATFGQRIMSAVGYTVAAAVCFIIVFVIVYAVGGYVEYNVDLLNSGVIPTGELYKLNATCLLPAAGGSQNISFAFFGNQCSAFGAPQSALWSVRPTFLVYAIAVASIIGWLLFMVFGGVGIVALPLDMIMRFKARPMKTITKSEYMAKAREIGILAQTLAAQAVQLKKLEQANGRSRKWRSQYRALNQEVNLLEDDQRELEKQYPQGEDREVVYYLYVFGFYLSLIGGIIFLIIGVTWVLQIFLYLVTRPPIHPFLNRFFSELDDIFPLFGVLAFALWCFFLILAGIKGFTKLGLNFGFITLYPMKLGATIMSSMLVNSALILLVSTAVVQFCAAAFAEYAAESTIWRIFGTEIYQLRYIKYIFRSNVFILVMLGVALLTLIWIVIRGPAPHKRKRQQLEDVYAS